MKTKLLLTLVLFTVLTVANAQQKPDWQKWTWLTGEWVGEGSGQPGQGDGTFSFKFDLDNNILVRKSHSEYPSRDNKTKVIHEDLMIVYCDYYGNPAKAIYFDNEGHTINYTVTHAEKSIIFTSEKIPDVPVFRLSYTLPENNIVDTKFEMSKDGVNFSTYIEGKSKKASK